MIVRIAKPPLFAEIDAAFDVGTQRIYYAWGDTIFDPFGDGTICAELLAHEGVHGRRQAGDPEPWWRRYLVEPAFRLAEEVPAFQAEYREFCRVASRTRFDRRAFVHQAAQRLSSPLYGRLVPYDRARGLIKAEPSGRNSSTAAR